MLIRSLSLLLSASVLFSASAAAQTRGGGGGRTPVSNPSPIRTTPPSYGTSNNSFPGSVPIHTVDDEGKIEFRTETILVQVPIVVTDKLGNHLHGLTKDDSTSSKTAKNRKSRHSKRSFQRTRSFRLLRQSRESSRT